ncbi:hypothetical protein E2C01_027931 [Portunus trituberculatus]|uniref:Uncharacterized protein n=1 Tax=Portunus trituberculatus TaxID=210409 RepID=A0A5B7EMZ3_PORTR|nr:hypothetical protein [Portunus trituberculatus]
MLRDLLYITTATVPATCSLRPPWWWRRRRQGSAGRGKERHVLSLYLSPYAPTLPLHQHLPAPARIPTAPLPGASSHSVPEPPQSLGGSSALITVYAAC